MYDFGNVNSHSKYLHWGDQDYLAGLSAFTVAAWLIPRNNAVSQDAFLAKSTGNNGYYVRADSAGANPQTIDFLKNDGTGWDIHKTSTTYTSGNTYSLMATFDGTKISWFKNGNPDGTPAGTRIILTNNGNLVMGNSPALNKGYACYLCHVVYWNKALTQADAQQFHAGVRLPEYESIVFWDTCQSLSTSEAPRIGGGTRTVSGVSLYSNAIDDYYLGPSYTREGTILQLRNPDGRLLPAGRGTIAFDFVPEWDHDESEGTKYLARLHHDADNYFELHWDGTLLTARFRCNATNYDSSLSGLTWDAGDAIKVGLRWLEAGDLGKDSDEGQLFAKVGSASWQQAVAVELADDLQEAEESFLYLGSNGTVGLHDAADGCISNLHCYPEAFPFEEIQGLLGE